MPVIVITGPQGCGKTRNAALLQAHFGCRSILDNDEDPAHAADWPDGSLVLMSGDLPADCVNPGGIQVLSYAEAVSDVMASLDRKSLRLGLPSCPLQATSVAGMSASTLQLVRSAGASGLSKALADLASAWFNAAGLRIEWRAKMGAAFLVAGADSRGTPMTGEQRAFLAAACDLHDLLAESPYGRKALLDLAFQPVAEHTKSE